MRPSVVPAVSWIAVSLACVAGSPLHAAQATPAGGESPARRDLSTLEQYSVVAVSDPATLTLRGHGRTLDAYLVGVDPPDDEGEFERAVDFLEQLLLGEKVYVEPAGRAEPSSARRAGPSGDDRPDDDPAGAGRASSRPGESPALSDGAFVHVYRVPDGLHVNVELVRQGYARVSSRPKFDQLDAFRSFEKKAREAGKGVWARMTTDRATSDKPADRDAPSGSRSASGANRRAGGAVVYVTKSGKKYHTEGCRFVTHGGTALTLAEAVARGLEPCSRCRPPGGP